MQDHPRAQRHDELAILILAGPSFDVVVSPKDAVLPAFIQELVDGELRAAMLDLSEELQRGQLDKDVAHAVDDAKDGGAKLEVPDLRVGRQLVRGKREVADMFGVQVHAMRDTRLCDLGPYLLQRNRPCFGDECIHALIEQRHSGSHGRVTCEGDLGEGQEDVDIAPLVSRWVSDVVDEDSLREVELAGDGLFLLVRGFGARGGNSDDGEGIAAEARLREDVDGGEGKFHGDLLCDW